MTRLLTILTVVITCFMGCSSNRKDNSKGVILEKEKMQAVMWDMIGADVFTDQFIKRDSGKNAEMENIQLQKKIFALHKITKVDYYKSYAYYIRNTSLMRELLDSMTTQAERERTKKLERHAGAQPK